MKKRILALLMTLALVLTCTVLTVSATDGDGGSASSTPTWESSAPVAFDGETMECPHCKKQVTWTAWDKSSVDGHYYVENDAESDVCQLDNYKQAGTGKTLVLWIKDNVTVRAKDGTVAFRVNAGEMWLLGGSGAQITGTGAVNTGTTKTNGGLLRCLAGATGKMYMSGDLTVQLEGNVTGGHMGGVIDLNAGEFHMLDGTINGTVNDPANSEKTAYGAVVIPTKNGKFFMSGGRIKGNGAGDSAPIYAKAGTVTLSGDAYVEAWQDNASNAGDGGAIWVDGGTVTVSENAYVKGGKFENGGAIYQSSGTLNITGGTVAGGDVSKGGAIYVAGGSMTVSGTATVNGGTTPTDSGLGGTIYVAEDASATISGGTVNGGQAYKGGTIYMDGGYLTMTNGTVNGGTCPATSDAQGHGGTIYINNDAEMDIQGGTVNAGTAYKGGTVYVNNQGDTCQLSGTAVLNAGTGVNQGGAIFVGDGAQFTMKGNSQIVGTKHTAENAVKNAANGGIAYLVISGRFIMKENALIDGGYATNGGAFAGYQGGHVEIHDNAKVQNATASGAGGMFNMPSNAASTANYSTFTMTGGTIDGCSAGQSNAGGAIYAAGKATINISGGLIQNCGRNTLSASSGGNGGMIYLAGATTTANISGGKLHVNTAATNIATGSPGLRLQEGATLNLSGDAWIACQTTSAAVSALYTATTVTLSGNARLTHPTTTTAARYITAVNYEGLPTVRVDNDWTGMAVLSGLTCDMGANFAANVFCGDVDAATWDPNGNCYNGKLLYGTYLDNQGRIIGVSGNGTMTRANAMTVNTTTGAAAAYATNQVAVDAAVAEGFTGYAKLHSNAAIEIAAGKTAYVDVFGNDVSVTNNGTLYAFDSTATTSAHGTGSVAVADTNAPEAIVEYDGGYGVSFYYDSNKDDENPGVYMFDRLEMKIANVTLRPGQEGLYYTAQFSGLKNALNMLDAVGVAVTTVEGASTNSLDQYLHTNGTNNSGAYTGVLIKNILTGDLQNMTLGQRATTKIYACAYFTVGEGENAQTFMVPAAKAYSLYDVVNIIAPNYDTLKGDQKTNFDALYEKYRDIELVDAEGVALTDAEGNELAWTRIAALDAILDAGNNSGSGETPNPEGGEDEEPDTGDGADA